MNNLVLYYSRTSNTETVAKEISKSINGELKKIELKKEISFMRAAFTAALGLKAKIKSMNFNVKDYDNIFIGTPVWAGKTSSPINTFLNEANLEGKNVFVFITQADNKTPNSVYDSIEKRVSAKGGKVIDNFFIQTDMKKPLTSIQAEGPVRDWINKNFGDRS
jgi:flavodoxin